MDAEKFRLAKALSSKIEECESFLYNLHNHKGFDVDIDVSFCGIEGTGDSVHFNLRNIGDTHLLINNAVSAYLSKIKNDFKQL